MHVTTRRGVACGVPARITVPSLCGVALGVAPREALRGVGVSAGSPPPCRSQGCCEVPHGFSSDALAATPAAAAATAAPPMHPRGIGCPEIAPPALTELLHPEWVEAVCGPWQRSWLPARTLSPRRGVCLNPKPKPPVEASELRARDLAPGVLPMTLLLARLMLSVSTSSAKGTTFSSRRWRSCRRWQQRMSSSISARARAANGMSLGATAGRRR
mmetsp:Transcript_42748/g.118024  ORF Transcript_42748/g.118024 Transcript_42748/m.118024 type:complete len:215 (-) Transcript_42748:2555-3199(-)